MHHVPLNGALLMPGMINTVIRARLLYELTCIVYREHHYYHLIRPGSVRQRVSICSRSDNQDVVADNVSRVPSCRKLSLQFAEQILRNGDAGFEVCRI
jgi:hypothetical protein